MAKKDGFIYEYTNWNEDFSHLESREKYIKVYEESARYHRHKNIKPKVRSWMNHFTPIGHSIIDLGCYNGGNLIHYTKQGYYCEGVEIVDDFIQQAHEEAAWQGVNIVIHKCWIEDFKTDIMFDNVLLTEILEHVINPKECVAVAKRILSNLGQIYISSPTKRTGSNAHVRGITTKDIKDWFGDYNIQRLFELKGNTYAVIKNKEYGIQNNN